LPKKWRKWKLREKMSRINVNGWKCQAFDALKYPFFAPMSTEVVLWTLLGRDRTKRGTGKKCAEMNGNGWNAEHLMPL
jgi:hypothetical protein